MTILKPLYGIAEAGTHWWATYFKHYKEKLIITTLIYNLCFLITTSIDKFSIVGMQTNNTIILYNNVFLTLEEDKLIKAKFTAKPK